MVSLWSNKGGGVFNGEQINRRKILKKMFLSVVSVAAAITVLYPVSRFIIYSIKRIEKIPFREYKAKKGVQYKSGVFLVNSNEDKLRALSARCTHLGCTINYDPVSRQFHCPCHGSRFDLSGKRLAGPARKHLQVLPIERKANGDIIVTKKL